MINQITLETPYGIVELVEIVDDNGNATQMLKSTYEAQQTEHFTPIVIDETKTK
jgi:hypothetical protein